MPSSTVAQSVANIGPGRFQRRHRMLIMAGILSALILMPNWASVAAMAAMSTAYLALLARPAALRAWAGLLVLALVAAAVLLPPGENTWWQLLAAMYFPVVIAWLNLNHLWPVPGPLAFVLRALVLLLILAIGLVFIAAWFRGPLPGVVMALPPVLLGSALAMLEGARRQWLQRPARREGTLSVLLVCKNEIDRIDQCLGRVAGWADEIVVLDSGSTDGTLERVRRHTDKVWETDWPGYGRQKQRALERCTGDWILNIDADEYVTEELRREIDARLSQPGKVTVFRIPWVSRVFGGLIYFGADGRYHKRLFRRENARFNDADVHEDVIIDGPASTLGAPVCHDTFRDYAHLRAKFTDYSLISARAMHGRGKSATPVQAFFRGVGSFLLLYFRRMGFFDGRRGLLMANVYAAYTFDKYAALWSLSRCTALAEKPAPGGADKAQKRGAD